MKDRFNCFSELQSEMDNGADFRIEWRLRQGSDFLIVAPHGGKIEPVTSELARAIADADLSYYSFEGCRMSKNKELHITSHKFDEPTALELAADVPKVLGIHGREDKNDRATAYLGGLDEQLVSNIQNELLKEGFPAISTGHAFPARHPRNICNRGTSGSGAQMELPLSFRRRLKSSNVLMTKYSQAVRQALSVVSC